MPTTTTGRATDFIQFSRTSNATVTAADGKIKWAGHNLLTNSESFDASAWTKTFGSITAANAVVAPNGTTTADVFTTSATFGLVQQTLSLVNVPHTFSVWIKAGTSTSDWSLYDASVGVTIATITPTSEWQLLTGTWTPSSVNTIVRIQDRQNSNTGSVYLWGAHLYRSDLGGMVLNPARGDAYYPTTPRNLLGFTEDFSNAAWPNLNLSVTTNSAVAPNGLQTADAIFETATTGRHRFRQAISVAPASSTVSVYAKANGRDFISINIDDGNTQYAVFNLATGAVGVTGGGAVAHTPVSAGNGWWRCAVTFTSLSTNGPYIHLRDTNSQPADYAGDVTKGVYLWGAQLSDSASLDAYSPVYGAAVTSAAYYAPRLDYDPVTLAARGLLVEELRANLAVNTITFSGWSGAATISATTNITPAGTANAAKVVEVASNQYQSTFVQPLIPSAGTYTRSVYAKAAERSWIKLIHFDGTNNLGAYFNLSNGTIGTVDGGITASISDAGNGWYRCVVTATTVAGATSERVQIVIATANNSSPTYTGDGTSGVLIWGAQLEAGAFATSYIPTTASATRAADVASVSTQAFPYSSTAGSIVVNADTYSFVAIRRNVQLDDGTASERMYIGTNIAAAPYAIVIDGNSTQADLTASGTLSTNTPYKLALAYNVNDFAACGNGGTVATDTSGTVPTVNTMRLGASEGGVYLNGHIRQITYIPRRLSNSELQQRTSV